jgi:hypothetical protein
LIFIFILLLFIDFMMALMIAAHAPHAIARWPLEHKRMHWCMAGAPLR